MRIISDEALVYATVWTEAEGEPDETMVGVCEVIRNRRDAHYDSDGSIAGTVAKRFQFSAWNDDAQDNARLIRALQLDDSDPIVKRIRAAWAESESTETTNGSVMFYADQGQKPPAWASSVEFEFVVQFGKTRFYRRTGLHAAGGAA